MSITWHTQDDIPTAPEVAVIAVYVPNDDGDPEPLLMDGLYIWNTTHHLWMGETSGLVCKAPKFMWTAEMDILRTLP